MPDDMLKYGFIPELSKASCGCYPGGLDQEALVRILTEPKNAVVKQYTRILQWDGVELEITLEDLLPSPRSDETKNRRPRPAQHPGRNYDRCDVEIPSMHDVRSRHN